jgi:uncharacterized membrane protein
MATVLDFVVLLLYPALVYFGLQYLGVRWTALAVLILVGRRFVVAALTQRSTSKIVLVQAGAMVTILALAALTDHPLGLRLAPFAVSLTFIATFAISLKTRPIIERFARMMRPDLPPDEVAYCRRLTHVWIGVLTANSLLLLAAVFVERDSLWTILVGPVSYGLFGVVFMVEYPYRKWLFQDFNTRNLLDRLLKTLLKRKEPR